MKKTEFELACGAKAGNQEDLMTLWSMYKNVCMGILYKVAHLENAELESEAFIVFHHKLFDLFDPNKIGCKPENWSFSFMVTGGMKNLRSKLINESKRYNEAVKLSYVESDDEEDTQSVSQSSQDRINYQLYGAHTFNVYNPEKLVISQEEPMDMRVKSFYAKLSAFEKALLEKRRAGLKLQEIADEFNCSLSKVKSHLKYAKEVASQVFEVAYA